MDHHGLLNMLRSLAITCQTTQQARNNTRLEWSWVHPPIVFPESHCVYCKATIRSPGIWFLGGDQFTRLFGMLKVTAGDKIELIQPSHPHETGGGNLCLGRNPTGIDLLATPPNLDDCPMGSYRVPAWYKRYWNHDCDEMREYLTNWGETDQLRLLDRL